MESSEVEIEESRTVNMVETEQEVRELQLVGKAVQSWVSESCSKILKSLQARTPQSWEEGASKMLSCARRRLTCSLGHNES